MHAQKGQGIFVLNNIILTKWCIAVVHIALSPGSLCLFTCKVHGYEASVNMKVPENHYTKNISSSVRTISDIQCFMLLFHI